jgi:hypothetical protein
MLPLNDRVKNLYIGYEYCINCTNGEDELGCVSDNLLCGMREPVSEDLLTIVPVTDNLLDRVSNNLLDTITL